MKKILINYIGKRGGGPAFAFEFAKPLSNNGFEVYVVVSKYVDNRAKWENFNNFKDVYFIETNRKSGKVYYLKAQLSFMLFGKRKLKKHFSNIKFDYVLTTMQHLWSIDISKILKKNKIAWICHDPIPHSGSGKIDTYLGNKFAKIADETIVLTKKFIPVVHDRWNVSWDHIHYMPHGRQEMYLLPKGYISRYPSEKYNFLFFGYLREYKGLKVLAKAFRRLSEERNDVTLTIAGSGDFSQYENDFMGIKNISIYNRYISDEEVGTFFYGENIITVMPYLDATQSGVSLTALEYGSVVIASNIGGLKEQLDDGNIGIYCEPKDDVDLYQKMLYVIDHPEFVKQQKEIMRNYLSTIEWDNVVKNIMEKI